MTPFAKAVFEALARNAPAEPRWEVGRSFAAQLENETVTVVSVTPCELKTEEDRRRWVHDFLNPPDYDLKINGEPVKVLDTQGCFALLYDGYELKECINGEPLLSQ